MRDSRGGGGRAFWGGERGGGKKGGERGRDERKSNKKKREGVGVWGVFLNIILGFFIYNYRIL